ncbi:MAG TPA: efflux RND transporter periplasmic adaptor subunit [Mizugakiibacter sp.]
MPSFSLRALMLGTFAALLAACGGSKQAPPPAPPEVGVVRAHAEDVPLVRDFVGRLDAYRTADVRARVAGILLKREYTEGTDVTRGQVLFRIDPAPLQAALRAAEAALAQARANAQNAEETVQRVRPLAAKGWASQQDLDNALANARSTAAAVKQAEANVATARLNLSYATVTAPIAGRAGQQMVTEGALVGQDAPTELTVIQQIDPIYVNFSQSFAELQQLRRQQAQGVLKPAGKGQVEVQVVLPDDTVYPHPGTLSFADIAVDPGTGALSLRGTVPNPDHTLLPGMFVKVRLTQGRQAHAFPIPQAAVQRDADGAYVLVVGADGKVAQKRVDLGDMRDGHWVVSRGLAEGDQVIVTGLQHVHAGDAAHAVPYKPLPAAQAGAR